METISYYDLLQVNPRADVTVIEAAYRARRKTLADSLKATPEVIDSLMEARRVLLDPAKRAEYDSTKNRLEGKIVGNYRVLELLAEGEFARTYKAEQILAGELVCIKQCIGISPSDDELLINEYKAICNLGHYALPIMRDIFRLEDGCLALVQSLLPGVTIEQAVKKVGRVDAESVCWITERVLNGLNYMHRNGVIHGGLEPGNIIVEDEDHTAAIIDFRFSVIDPTKNRVVRGYIPYFASPEQIQEATNPLKLSLLPQSDFYSLGKTILYALSGGDLEAVEKNKFPEFVPTPLKEFIERLTEPEVLKRPDWDKEDLLETMATVREKSFNRRRSGMKPITGA